MRRIQAVVALAIASCLASVVGVGADEPRVDALAVKIIEIDTEGPLGPITVFGDSVMYGSAITSPTLPDQLVARGWGPIRFVAGAGFNTGKPFRAPDAARITWWIDTWRNEGWEPSKIVVNLGSNDSLFCGRDAQCMRDTVTHVMDKLGPESRVWWPQMTLEPSRATEQFLWNTALAQRADELPNLETWDWPTEMANGPYPSGDNIHISGDGYRLRSVRMADLATARLATGRASSSGPVELPTATTAASGFVPVTAARLVDTRVDPPGRQNSGSVLSVDLGDHVPEGTTAAALYVTAVRPNAPGFLSVAPCGASSDASTVNFVPGVTRGAPTLAMIGDDRTVCVRTVGDADVTVDLQGAFHPTDERAVGLDPLDVPRRLADTRRTGLTDRLVVDAPTGASAVAVNITAVGSSTPGHVVAAPCDEDSPVASLNFRPGAPIAASAIVEVDDDGTFCLSTVNRSHLVVDLTGTFSTTGALSFVPVTPTRTLDTRDGTGGWEVIHGAEETVRLRAAPAEAAAVSGTITLVRPWDGAFLTGFGCVGDPDTSSVNGPVAGIAPNSLTTSVDDGDLCITASVSTHTLFDTTGWWVGR